MFAFQTLSAGNIGHPAAPGTVVDNAAEGRAEVVFDAGEAVVGGTEGAAGDDEVLPGDGDTDALVAAGDADAQPLAVIAASTTTTATRRTEAARRCSSVITVASWHAHKGRACRSWLISPSSAGPAEPVWMRFKAKPARSDLLYSGLPWRHAP